MSGGCTLFNGKDVKGSHRIGRKRNRATTAEKAGFARKNARWLERPKRASGTKKPEHSE